MSGHPESGVGCFVTWNWWNQIWCYYLYDCCGGQFTASASAAPFGIFQCREKLELRQRLMAEDVRVEHTFYSKCRTDIEKYHCLGGSTGHEDAKRASVLLCLESAHMDGEWLAHGPFWLAVKCEMQVCEMVSVRSAVRLWRLGPLFFIVCFFSEFWEG